MEEEANEDSTPEVFRNQVVLREMFKYLPTSTLISSCSLVNKLWREQSRSFIRDYRECTVNLGVNISATVDQPTNLWEQLCELDRVLEKMATIPFNSIRVVVAPSPSDKRPRMNTLPNLMSRLPLKYLRVFDDSGMKPWGRLSCLVSASILELVQKNSSKLLELEIRTSRIVRSGRVFKDWEPPQRFENLKRLSISKQEKTDCAKKIIFGASNLKSIHNNCLDMIPNVIPENMYGILKRLAFRVQDVDRVEQFADKLCHLEEMLLNFGSSRDSALKIRCVTLFQELLALNVSSLCSFGVRCYGDEDAILFNQLQLPLLPSVTTLSIFVEHFASLVHITALNMRECLPNLCNVHIGGLFSDNNDANDGMVLQEDVIVAPNASETTMELTIDGMVTTSHLATLRSLFPNVIKLSFTCLYDFPPLGLTGIMWPNLQSLSFLGRRFQEEEVGAQVFGTNPEEWKLLCQQDKEVLKQLQLVPSRPCVLTMRGLKNFQLLHRYQDDDPDVEAYLQFLEPLVIDRMPGLSFKIKKVLTDPCWSTRRFRDLFEERFFGNVVALP